MISKVTNRERFFLFSLSSMYSNKKTVIVPMGFLRQLNYFFIVIMTKLNFKTPKALLIHHKFAEKILCAYQISTMHKVLCQQYLTICNYYSKICFEKISNKEIKK